MKISPVYFIKIKNMKRYYSILRKVSNFCPDSHATNYP